MNLRQTLLFLFLSCSLLAQQVGINTQQPDASALFDISGTAGGLLIPRMSAAQRNAIQNPAEGLLILNTSTSCLEIHYLANGWQAIACNCTTAPLSPASISGYADVCPSQANITYVAAPSSGATTYTWQLPSGWSIVSGQGNDTLVATAGAAGGTISVVASNPCGTSSPTLLPVTVRTPNAGFTNAPATISVGTNIQFTSNTANASAYAWSFQNGSPGTATSYNPISSWSQTGNPNVFHRVTLNAQCKDSSTTAVTVINCPAGSQTFSYTGSMQTFTVPNCVTSVNITCNGAAGGDGHNPGNQPKGQGGIASGTLSVTPGQTLYIYVGGQGQRSSSSPMQGGWNGGGNGYNYGNTGWTCAGGGGASDVRSGGTALANRVIVAGGGGGGGGSGSWGNGGGGNGGGNSGANGYDVGGGGYGGDRHGKGGTQNSGGAGGSDLSGGSAGSAGTLGFGGNASTGSNTLASGGGGGYYGGGGGSYHGGGGGGGSSYTGGVTNGSTSSGGITGNGSVVITW